MTENYQSEPLDDELLSAYVDGELAGAELAQVEQRLANDPRAQQLVDELRALSREVKSLPQEALGVDLQAMVMQRAEREMLLGSDEPGSRLPREQSTPRRWMWAAMALAATLLLSLYLPDSEPEDRKLADAQPAAGGPPKMELTIDSFEGERAAQSVEPQDDIVVDAAPEIARDETDIAKDNAAPENETLLADTNASSDAGGALGGERARAARVPAARAGAFPASAPSPFACAVHVTVNDPQKSFQQFDQVLANNYIALEKEPETGAEEKEALARAYASQRNQPARSAQREAAAQEEVWVVEASTEQFEEAIKEINADTSNFLALEVVEQEPQEATLVKQLLQYNRKGNQIAQNNLQELKETKKAAKLNQLGRARRIEPEEYRRQWQGEYGKADAKQYRGFDSRKRAIAKVESNATMQTQQQFLFILKAQNESVKIKAASPPER